MPTCGYICPSCEGKEVMEDGTPCSWCQPAIAAKPEEKKETLSDEEWMNAVHFGDCCSDRSSDETEKNTKGAV